MSWVRSRPTGWDRVCLLGHAFPAGRLVVSKLTGWASSKQNWEVSHPRSPQSNGFLSPRKGPEVYITTQWSVYILILFPNVESTVSFVRILGTSDPRGQRRICTPPPLRTLEALRSRCPLKTPYKHPGKRPHMLATVKDGKSRALD